MPHLNTDPESSSCNPDAALLAEFGQLWTEVDNFWEDHRNDEAFGGYVSADFAAIYESLAELRGRVLTVLEWGSGLGVVTIMASRMGFEAYGIESEPRLVEYAEQFAESYGPNARFAQGSFIPEEFEWNFAGGDDVMGTVIDIPSAYGDLDMELRDFDLVYAFPWPDEHILFRHIMGQCGRSEALFLIYDAREGLQFIPAADR